MWKRKKPGQEDADEDGDKMRRRIVKNFPLPDVSDSFMQLEDGLGVKVHSFISFLSEQIDVSLDDVMIDCNLR